MNERIENENEALRGEVIDALTDKMLKRAGAAEVQEHGAPEQLEALTNAICKASLNFTDPKKTSTGRTGNQAYKYAPLTELRAATRPHLLAEGVLPLQFLSGPTPDGKHRLTTQLRGHGAKLESVLEFDALDFRSPGDCKDWGSLTTYLRRYTYQAILQLDGDMDADDDPRGGSGDKSSKDDRPKGQRSGPPALEGQVAKDPRGQRQETRRARSEPPPKPDPRPEGKVPERPAERRPEPRPEPPPAHAGADFKARVAAGRQRWGKQDSEPPRPQEPDPRQMAIPGSFPEFEGGDRPTKPIPEPAPKKPPVVQESSTLPVEKLERFEELTKALKLGTGPEFLDWVERRINKRKLSEVTEPDLDFLISSAEEQLAEGAA